MAHPQLKQTAAEIDAALRDANISPQDRAALERARSELQAALSSDRQDHPPSLRSSLQTAVDALERSHPQLTSALAKSLELLSDIGL